MTSIQRNRKRLKIIDAPNPDEPYEDCDSEIHGWLLHNLYQGIPVSLEIRCAVRRPKYLCPAKYREIKDSCTVRKSASWA